MSYPMDRALMEPRRRSIDLVVVHYTALGAPMSRALMTQWERELDCLECSTTGLVERRRCRLCKGTGKVDLQRMGPRSAHYLIAKEGVVEQLAPQNMVTYHSGHSRWKGRGQVNQRSIGIELENYGPLDIVGNQLRTWVGQAVYADALPFQDEDGYWWERYPEVQLAALRSLAEEINSSYPDVTWVGHEEIRRGKRDPGPAFPWDELRRSVF